MINQNDSLLDEYIGGMFGQPVSPPTPGTLFPDTLEPVRADRALQCTWAMPRNQAEAVTAALMLWQLFHGLPVGRLRVTLHRRGRAMLGRFR